MTTKLTLFNGALRDLGERKLANLTENREPRRILDDIWDTGIRDLALSEGQWKFAIRTVQIEFTSDVEPDFGFNRAFEKPSDWIRTAALSTSEYFEFPLEQYADEANYWYADYDTLYIKFVSKGDDYGYDLTGWPINFVRYFQALMAMEAAPRLTQSRVKASDLEALVERRKKRAQSTDAMNGPARFPPQGAWSSARMRGNRPRRRAGGWSAN